MKRIVVSSLGAFMFAAAVASAAPVKEQHLIPGIPGVVNCHGQTSRWFAQAAKNFGMGQAIRGLGQLARIGDFDVTYLEDTIRVYCAEGGGQ